MAKGENKKPVLLAILDGWGVAPAWGGNAVAQARTPIFSKIWRDCPSATIQASGQSVGLPSNSPGNSEAGHINIGAGHVVHQDVTVIDQTIDDGSFFNNPLLLEAFEHCKKNNSKMHLAGLLSKAGIHSHLRHLYALLELAKRVNFTKVYIHLFSDGRDSDPMSGIEMLAELEAVIKEKGVGRVVSISGRYFAMDRDNRWGRLARAYNLLVKAEGNTFDSPMNAFSSAYAKAQTDEFIEPRLICNKTFEKITIDDNDSVVLFNIRSDRTHQMIRAFLDDNLPEFPDRKKLNNLFFCSFCVYSDDTLSKRVFSPEKIVEPLAKVWSDHGLSQLHISESEKYPHVTYFINGGIEPPYPGEKRITIASPKSKTYDFCPQMSALEVTNNLTLAIKNNQHDCYIVNFANPDMVGHTGNISATIQAIEYVDKCLARVLTELEEKDGLAFVISDHGNSEQMVNPRTGQPDTEHTTNPVPFIMVSKRPEHKNAKFNSDGVLASVAPTMLEVMGISKPASMAKESLLINNQIVL